MSSDWVLIQQHAPSETFRFWRGWPDEKQELENRKKQNGPRPRPAGPSRKRKQTGKSSRTKKKKKASESSEKLEPAESPDHVFEDEEFEVEDLSLQPDPEILIFGDHEQDEEEAPAQAGDFAEEGEDSIVGEILEAMREESHTDSTGTAADRRKQSDEGIGPGVEEARLDSDPVEPSGSSGSVPAIPLAPAPHVGRLRERGTVRGSTSTGAGRTQDVSVTFDGFGDLRFNYKSSSFTQFADHTKSVARPEPVWHRQHHVSMTEPVDKADQWVC